MRIVTLPTVWTVVTDFFAWGIIQPAVVYLSLRFPPLMLDHRRWLFRTRPWELGGQIYDKLFRVRGWKSKLPSGGGIVGGDFSMDRVRSRRPEHLKRWVVETCRSEFCHWIAIAASPLFFLWNPPRRGFRDDHLFASLQPAPGDRPEAQQATFPSRSG